MGRKTGLAFIGVGVFLLVLAVLSKFYAYDKLAVVPADQNTVNHSTATNATIFDIASQGELKTNLVSTQNVVGDPTAGKSASDSQGKPVAVWETLVYTTKAGQKVTKKDPPLSATHDRVAFDSNTAQAINCCGNYLTTTTSTDTGAEERDTKTPITGLYYKFPFDAQKQTYKFWDGNLKTSTDAVYKDTEKIQGLNVYRYEQVIKPTKVSTITAPASFFGIKKAGNVTIDDIYANTRTLWVEPVTGVIIRGQENQHVVGDYQGKQVAILTDALIGYDNATITDNVNTYKPKAMQLTIIKSTLPLVGSILGLLLIIAGGFLLFRSRRADDPTDDSTGSPVGARVA